MDTIRLPLVSVYSRKKRDTVQGLESQAVLASMETLEDHEKNDDKGEELKQVPLDVSFVLKFYIFCAYV